MDFACSPHVCLGSLASSHCQKKTKNMHLRWIGDSKLTLGVSVSVHGCSSWSGPVMDWQPVQVVPSLSPNGSWNRLQATLWPWIGLNRYRKWVDERHKKYKITKIDTTELIDIQSQFLWNNMLCCLCLRTEDKSPDNIDKLPVNQYILYSQKKKSPPGFNKANR